MGGATAVATEQVEELLGRAIGRTGIAGRHDAAEPIAAVSVGDDRSTEIEVALALVEERIVAQRIGVPDLDGGARDWRAGRILHLAVHEQDLAFVRTVVDARLALAYRCARNIKRPFDRPRRAGGIDTDLPFLLVQPDVEIMLDTQSGREKRRFVRLSELGHVAQCRPEFLGSDIEIIDHVEEIEQQAVDDRLDPLVCRFDLSSGNPRC